MILGEYDQRHGATLEVEVPERGPNAGRRLLNVYTYDEARPVTAVVVLDEGTIEWLRGWLDGEVTQGEPA